MFFLVELATDQCAAHVFNCEARKMMSLQKEVSGSQLSEGDKQRVFDISRYNKVTINIITVQIMLEQAACRERR